MRSIRILGPAAEEAAEAADWYETECPGLGKDFVDAVDAALDLIQDDILPLSPLPGEAGAKGAARLVLKRFPYDIVVIEQPAMVLVVAVAHHARKPGYWRERTSV